MSTTSDPEVVESFLARCRAIREAEGKPRKIQTERVYRLIDAVVTKRPTKRPTKSKRPPTD